MLSMALLPRAVSRALLLATVTLVACSHPKPSGTTSAPSSEPVPEPQGLMAEVFMPRPGDTWTKARTLIGGNAALLPEGFSSVASLLLGLPATVADQVDADIPALGAITTDGTATHYVLGLHIKDGPHLIQALSVGPTAKLNAHLEPASSVTLLDPKTPGAGPSIQLGVSQNYLLVSMDKVGLTSVGPYISRTMPKERVPTGDLVLISHQTALAGPIKDRITHFWESYKKRGAVAGGDPTGAILNAQSGVESLLTMLGDLKQGTLAITLDNAGAHAHTLLEPASDSGAAAHEIAAMVVGSPEGMLDLPADVSLAIETRDSAALRQQTAEDQLATLEKAFGTKLRPEDKSKTQAALQDWAQGRGDWVLLSAALSPGGNRVFLRSAVADPARFDQAVKEFSDFPRMPTFAEPLRHWLGDTKMQAVSAKPGEPSLLRFDHVTTPAAASAGKDAKPPPFNHFEVAWQVGATDASFAIAADGKAALQALVNHAPGATLGSEPEIAASLRALGNQTTFTMVLLPLRFVTGLMNVELGPKGKPAAPPPPAAPVVFGLGRNSDGAYLHLDVASQALRDMLKMLPMLR